MPPALAARRHRRHRACCRRERTAGSHRRLAARANAGPSAALARPSALALWLRRGAAANTFFDGRRARTQMVPSGWRALRAHAK